MNASPSNETTATIHDVIIIGAGPCGLAVAARMRERTPSALFADFEHQRYHWLKKHEKRQNKLKTRGRAGSMVLLEENQPSRRSSTTSEDNHHMHSSAYSIQVFDSTGSKWMARWQSLFAALDIKSLRSPLFFHPGPEDRDGLKAFAMIKGRAEEMVELKSICGKEVSKHHKKKAMKRNIRKEEPRGKSIDERDRQDYFTPSTDLFADYCTDCVDRYRLDKLVHQSDVYSIRYHSRITTSQLSSEHSQSIFTVHTSSGTHHARTIVLATGPGIPNAIPINDEEAHGACHSSSLAQPQHSFLAPHVQARISQHKPTSVLVLGGGLTSAQIIDLALKQGVERVYHVLRGKYRVQHFDLGLSWVAKFKNFNLAEFYNLESDEERARALRMARGGGSVTPAYDRVLKAHVAKGRLLRFERMGVKSKTWDSKGLVWDVQLEPLPPPPSPLSATTTTTSSSTTEGHSLRIDYIYYATGSKADISTLPTLQEMLAEHPIPIVEGLPCLTDELQWTPDIPLFIAGRFAGLRLGPGAANLEGARAGAERIVCRLQEVLGQGRWRARSEVEGGVDGVAPDALEDVRRGFALGGNHVNMFSALADE